MMKIMRYLLPKIISANKKIFISIILIACFGVSVLTAMLNSYVGVKESFEAFFEDYHMADVTVLSSEVFAERKLNTIADIEGVEEVIGRLCVDGEARWQENYFTLRCFSAEQEQVYIIEEFLGEVAEDIIPVGFEPAFVKMSGLQLGDTFTLHVQGKPYTCIYATTLNTPECIRVQRNEIFNFGTDEFGYAFFEYEDLKKMCNLPDNMYNQVLIQSEEGCNREDIRQRVLQAGQFEGGVQSYTYENSPIKIMVDECVEPLRSLCYMVSVIFMLIIVVMIYLFIFQIIMEQKEKTGILMALGGSNREIARIYYGFGAIVAVGATVLGNILGYVFVYVVGWAYQSVFYFPKYIIHYSGALMLVSFLFIAVTVGIALIVVTAQILHMEPAEAVRSQQTSEAGAVKGTFLKGLNYMQKVCLCCAIRNKRRTILSFVSTILTVALIVFVFQYSNAGDYMVEHTFQERFRYDCEVMFDKFLTENEADALLEHCDGIEKCELFENAVVELEAGQEKISRLLYGISQNSEMVSLCTRADREILIEGNGIVLAKHTADVLKVAVGDTIMVNQKPIIVRGIHEECLFFLEYCSNEEFQNLVHTGYSGAYLTLKEGVSRKDVYAALEGKSGFSYLSMKSSQQEGVEHQIANSETTIPIVVVMGMAIGITIIYNMSLINYKERKHVFAIMMTLGVDAKKIAQATFMELVIQYVISMVIGTGVGMLAGSYLLKAVSGDSKWYQTEISIMNLLPIAICVGISMLVGHLLSLQSMKHMDIVEELKSRE